MSVVPSLIERLRREAVVLGAMGGPFGTTEHQRQWMAERSTLLNEAADAAQERDDLAMLLRQLIYRNNKGLTLDERLAAAGEYMTRKKLNGSVLRNERGDCISTAPASKDSEGQ